MIGFMTGNCASPDSRSTKGGFQTHAGIRPLLEGLKTAMMARWQVKQTPCKTTVFLALIADTDIGWCTRGSRSLRHGCAPG